MSVNEQSEDVLSLPELYTLFERHRGLTPFNAGSYAEAATVCLGTQYEPPKDMSVAVVDSSSPSVRRYRIDWRPAGGRLLDAYKNMIDTAEAGAYSVVLAAAEVHLGLVAISRAEQGTGADYYLGPPDSLANAEDGEIDLEDAVRLEVSGLYKAHRASALVSRLNTKVEQARNGKSNLPAIAGVAAFDLCQIMFKEVSLCQ